MTAMKFIIDDDTVADFLGIQESQFIVDPSYFLDKLIERATVGVDVRGDPLPWSKTTTSFRMRPGEVTVWAGINGHGKSQVLGQVALWLLPDTIVTIASLEMAGEATLHRMVRQASGIEMPTIDYMKNFVNWCNGKFYIYDELDTIRSDRILAMVHYSATNLNSKHIIIDSLMKCISGADDYNAQKSFIDKLTKMAKKHDVHIHIVHHMRKGSSEEVVPDKFDVKGAGDVVDQVDNLIIIHRNKSKERKSAAGEDVDLYSPDTILRIAKQRHGEWEGDFHLWFDRPSQQYVSKPNHGAMPWPYPGAEIF